jgi:hypothetical protein
MLADRISVIQRSRTLECWIKFSSLIIAHLGLCAAGPRQQGGGKVGNRLLTWA